MTKKNFESIAKIIRESNSFRSFVHKKKFIQEMSSYLSTTNPNFNKSKFFKACISPHEE